MFNLFKKKQPKSPPITSPEQADVQTEHADESNVDALQNLESSVMNSSQTDVSNTGGSQSDIHEVADTPEPLSQASPEPSPDPSPEPSPDPKPSFFSSLAAKLSRTKESIGSGIADLFVGRSIDDELYEDLETQLLVADVGMDTTQNIIEHLTQSTKRSTLKNGEALLGELKAYMGELLTNIEAPLIPVVPEGQKGPFVILMVGVNGVGKTTTIGKMAKQFQQDGKKVMLAAGDTFRAAAVEQLQVWGERNDIAVVAQHTGADSASVLYDAIQSAQAKNIDVLIADTAGRLQNKDYLMQELEKVVRVIRKINPDAPHEIMLTIDAGTGQNAISQAKLFHDAVGLTGITLSKLDGTAKGGVIFSIADQFSIPVRYIGVGEAIDDLRPFQATEFIDALFEPTK